jgi:hypothetical protein
MNTLNYCTLPSIPCSKRTGNDQSYFPEDKNVCHKFNPDQVQSYVNQNNLNQYNVCYKDYPKEGKPGDYICRIENNRCVGKPVDCKVLDKKKKEDKYVKVDVDNEIKCMPPNTKNCPVSKDETNVKLYINGKPFYECQKNDPMCISDVYSSSNQGMPIVQNTADPVDRKVLYTREFEEPILNKRIVSCPQGYNPCGDMCCFEDKKCVPIENSILGSPYPFCEYDGGKTNLFVDGAPKTGEFSTENDCLSWCAKNPECKAMVRYLDRHGNLQCRYYKYDTKDNRIKMVEDKTAMTYNRRKHSYVTNI